MTGSAKQDEIPVPLSEAQNKRLENGDASLRNVLWNWIQASDAADKLSIGDMKKLTTMLRQFSRALSVEHYGNGFRDGAEEAKRLMATAKAEDGSVLPEPPAVNGSGEHPAPAEIKARKPRQH